jgi:phosphatidate cytidylyltransferase
MSIFKGIDMAVLNVFVGIFVILILASLTSYVLQWRSREKDYTELRQRVRSWWIIIILFALAILLSRTVTIVFFGFLSFLAFKEFLTIIPTRRTDHRVLFWAYLSIPIQYIFIGYEEYGMFTIFIPVYVFLFLPIRMVIAGETKGFLKAAGVIHWGLMTTVFSISHITYLFVLPPEGSSISGTGLVLFLVLLTQLNDVAQYIFGKSFGRKKILPKVSPNKTWEGFIGGIITTSTLSFFFAPILTPISGIASIAIGVTIAIAGFAGDVIVSALKRDLNVKDCGSILPGHGGVLDRLDSLTYTAPIFFHLVKYFYF